VWLLFFIFVYNELCFVDYKYVANGFVCLCPFLPCHFQKLEDKFNANVAQKVQLQTKLKVRTLCSFMDMIGKL
jgi:hypothetical protein